jgi:hypothetical protein
MRTRSSLAAMLAAVSCLTIVRPQLAHAGPAIEVGAARPGAGPTAVPLLPKAYRLAMTVTMLDSGDAHEGPGNTEDEIYFALAGLTEIGGTETLRIRRTVRPQISRDFWEMGAHSANAFEVTIFEGSLRSTDTATFAMLLGEQDNASAAAIASAFTLAIAGLVERIAIDLAVGDETTQLSMDKLSGEVDKLGAQMVAAGDELMGALEIHVAAGKLKVGTPANTSSTLLSSTATTASVRLSGGGGKYRVDLRLEDRDTPPPRTRTFLSREHDACGQANLWVDSKAGAPVLVHKGDGGVPVRVAEDVFHWHCGSLAEDDTTNAPDDTKLVEVTRAASGSAIDWDTYHEATAQPQYSW